MTIPLCTYACESVAGLELGECHSVIRWACNQTSPNLPTNSGHVIFLSLRISIQPVSLLIIQWSEKQSEEACRDRDLLIRQPPHWMCCNGISSSTLPITSGLQRRSNHRWGSSVAQLNTEWLCLLTTTYINNLLPSNIRLKNI
jgi:hypothetical protein